MGPVSSRVALLLRSAEGQPFFASISQGQAGILYAASQRTYEILDLLFFAGLPLEGMQTRQRRGLGQYALLVGLRPCMHRAVSRTHVFVWDIFAEAPLSSQAPDGLLCPASVEGGEIENELEGKFFFFGQIAA